MKKKYVNVTEDMIEIFEKKCFDDGINFQICNAEDIVSGINMGIYKYKLDSPEIAEEMKKYIDTFLEV